MKKNYFYFIIVLTLIVTHSCRQESTPMDEIRKETGIQKQINYSDLISKIGQIDPDILKVKSKYDKNSFEEFQIDVSKIIEVQNSETDASYSMRVQPLDSTDEDGQSFYNLYIKKNNGVLTQTIVKYTQGLEYTLGLSSTFTGSYEIVATKKDEFSGKSGSCYEMVVAVACDAGNIHPHDGPDHCNGYGGSWHFYFQVCSGGGSGSGSGDSGSGNNYGSGTIGGTSGGGGSGGSSGNGAPAVMISPDGTAINDPCVKASASIIASTSMLKNSQVKQHIDDVLKPKIQAPNEFGRKVGKFSHNGVTYYSFSELEELGPTGGTLTKTLPQGAYVADAHSHAGARGNPSAGDFYDMLGKITSAPQFTTKFIYGNDYGTPEVYALVFTDKALASAFLAKYPRSQNFNSSPQSQDFFIDSPIGIEYFSSLEYAKNGTFQNTNTEGENYSSGALAMAYILEKFNTGISLAKVDAQGNLKKIIVTKEIITPLHSTPKPGLKVGKCP